MKLYGLWFPRKSGPTKQQWLPEEADKVSGSASQFAEFSVCPNGITTKGSLEALVEESVFGEESQVCRRSWV